MDDTELISIGEFARRTRLTASALRFYDDAGLLHPEEVDPLSGYRMYSESQLEKASQLRQLRLIGMPLSTVSQFFEVHTAEALRLIDEQAAKATAEASEIQQVAAALKTSLRTDATFKLCVLPGPVFASAFDQVLATTTNDPEAAVLAGVRLEASPDAITLTATDRYRLASRTLVPSQPSNTSWAGILAGDDLQSILPRIRRSPSIALKVGEETLAFHASDGSVSHCRLLTDVFPDYRLLISSLPDATHRVTIESQQILQALEHAPEKIGLQIADGQPRLLLPGDVLSLNGTAAGPDLTVWFELTTLYPALSHTLGGDAMFDLRGPDQPTTVRSADNGDLTTLVMPCHAD